MALMAGLRRLRGALAPPLRGLPLLLGPSRKGFLGKVTGVYACALGCMVTRVGRRERWQPASLLGLVQRCMQQGMAGPSAACPLLPHLQLASTPAAAAGRMVAADRDAATAAAAALCVAEGANIIRAHNVPAVRDALRVADAFCALRR